MKKFLCFMLFSLCITLLFMISLNVDVKDTYAANVFPYNGIINADSLVVYNSTNTIESNKATELAYGTRVNVLEETTSSLSKISYDGNIGYTWTKFIINVDTRTSTVDLPGVETYSEYSNILKEKGFPDSYHPYLYYIHAKHPTWIFKADYTGYTIEETSKNMEGKLGLQTNNKNYWIEDYPYEAGGYYHIKASTIASFVDPRNSLFEERIFQFLDLDDTKDLASDKTLNYIVGEGNLKQYLEIFKAAASQQGINVVQLVSRSNQEGNNGDYGPSSGQFTTRTGTTYNNQTLDGFYNFYNIGAYNGNGLTPQARGVAYAAGYIGGTSFGRPWDTPEKAIHGGADFIANDYIRKGQDTNYYQSVNVASYATGTKFAHYYMSNIWAPKAEGNNMMNTYKNSGELELPFIFTIPVYKDMDNNYQPVNKNSNNKLSSITIDDKLITGFDKDVVEYQYNAVTDKQLVKIDAKTEVATSKVDGLGEYTFVNGEVNINLTVTAEDGSKKVYTILVKQVLPEQSISVNDIVSKMAVRISGQNMYGISPGTLVSELTSTVQKNGGVAQVTNANGNVVTTGVLMTGYKIKIKGTSEELTYTISVRGDVNGDGVVKINDLILVQSHILGTRTVTGDKFYAADVNYDGNVKINDLILIQSHILGKGNL
ncbi:MAG: hypothetical protein K2H20_01220 [Bacilli bacterium]|nr:hypothetical protein [Bacilli bacterium]